MTIIPVKYIVVLSIFCLIICPIMFYIVSFILFYVLTLGNTIVPYYVVFIVMAAGLVYECVVIFPLDYEKLIIKDGTISNWIFDGTHNEGWCEEILNIKKVELVGKEEVQKYYKEYKGKKAILIDFGNYKVRYIHVGLFSKRQIKKIMNLLNQTNNDTTI